MTPRTLSGPDGSSNKRIVVCATDQSYGKASKRCTYVRTDIMQGKSNALYTRFRPNTFDEVIGQENIIKVFLNQLKAGSVSHAYLLCGIRGTGKTTLARLMAKAVNCLDPQKKPCGACENCRSITEESHMDVIEIDAASNNGVDDVRELIDTVAYPPSVAEKKVYIIDEVHMLSQGAFNALLKTLEEPPSHVIFIFATTDPNKIPKTILSRCMRFDLRRITESDLVKRLGFVCESCSREIEEDALKLIAVNAEGSLRDALSILEQVMAIDEGIITREDVLESLHAVGDGKIIEIMDGVLSNDLEKAIVTCNNAFDDGKDEKQFLNDLLIYLRNMMLAKVSGELDALINMHSDDINELKRQASGVSMDFIERAIFEIVRIIDLSKGASYPRILIEAGLIKISNCLSPDKSIKKEETKPSDIKKSSNVGKNTNDEMPVVSDKSEASETTAVSDEVSSSDSVATTSSLSETTSVPAETSAPVAKSQEGMAQGKSEKDTTTENNEFIFESDELSGLSISIDKLTGKKEEKTKKRDIKDVMKEVYNIDVVEEE